MSGLFDIIHIVYAVISCAIVSTLCSTLLFVKPKDRNRFTQFTRFTVYIGWELWQIVLANIHVASLALSPRLNQVIDPKIIRFKTVLKKDRSLVTFANSITLTPGTITLLIEEGEYYVHAISKKVAEGLPGEMERKVHHVFEEE
jgi:multicomponent Na+:H+ antiporter subunit E